MCEDKSKSVEMEYVKLWMQQSTLFWGRLQTAALIQTGMLAAWYQLSSQDKFRDLQFGILVVGGVLSVVLQIILVRDAQFMKRMASLAGSAFPAVKSCPGLGQACGFGLIWALIVTDVMLFIWTWRH